MRPRVRSYLFVALGAMVLLVLVVATCSSGEDTPSSPSPTPTKTGSATKTPTTKPSGSATPASADSPTPDGSSTETPTPEDDAVYYVVQEGDALFDIALRFDVTLEDLMTANNIDDPTLLQIGQELYIPIGGDLTPPVRTPTEPPAPTPTPDPPGQVNGIPDDQIIVMSGDVVDHVREIWARGQEAGENPHAFSVVGDSTVELPHFLSWFDGDSYNLGDYAYLQEVIDQFKGSFEHDNVSVHVGMHSWSAFDPFWASDPQCNGNEGPVECEVRTHKPVILLIRLGSNDAGIPDSFKENLDKIVKYAIDNGVIPVLGTKADRAEGSNENNDIIRQVAEDNRVPLWDWDRVAETLPNKGIDPSDPDGVHLVFYPEADYTKPEAFERGHGVHNLTALIVLDEVLRAASQ